MKDAAKNVATKTLTEVGNRGSQKVVDKIIPLKEDKLIPPGIKLNEGSKDILNKYVKIQDYVKKFS